MNPFKFIKIEASGILPDIHKYGWGNLNVFLFCCSLFGKCFEQAANSTRSRVMQDIFDTHSKYFTSSLDLLSLTKLLIFVDYCVFIEVFQNP